MADRYTGHKGELNFEDDLVQALVDNGWNTNVLKQLTVKQKGNFDDSKITSLEGNFRKILNERNQKELNGIALSNDEFDQVMQEIRNAYTPVKANVLINGKDIKIMRDIDSKDAEHAGKPVYLNIFEPAHIASGTTRYQIARQTIYETGSMKTDRRGDVTLLINGLPVIHIELKARNVPLADACNQIVKYANEGVFTGLMGLVQVFYVMNPDDAVYFSNFGEGEKYNDVYVFHWTDEKDNKITDWMALCKGKYATLSVPEAHQFVGYYVVADKNKDVLRVMRSYQYFSVKAVLSKVSAHHWGTIAPLGGICWCTTGGGKTLSAFKAGQMLRDLNMVDKVVYVVDRVALNTQTLEDYDSFSRKGETVQGTENTNKLFNKLKSSSGDDVLILTSIQKMKNIKDETCKLKSDDLEIIKSKRIVFIVDEAQRSQFGEMHKSVKNTFPYAMFFGFTGTPIMGEQDDDTRDTRTVFGKYISVYTLANGIKDGNVLGFNPSGVRTYEDKDLRERVALSVCKATSYDEIKDIPELRKIYKSFVDGTIQMPSEYIVKKQKKNKAGKWVEVDEIVKGIEGYLPSGQYDNDRHRNEVVNYILDNWDILAIGDKGTRFHAMLATSSIKEAIEYYRIFKDRKCGLNVFALFDPNTNANGDPTDIKNKEDAIEEILTDYNAQYGTSFTRTNDAELKDYKDDIMKRMAHKNPYHIIGNDPAKIIDIVIVVDQLLTGYDSQYVNTLYLDNVMESSKLIQAISRTNRVFDNSEKPFGNFRFFRKIYTMKENLHEAIRLYCEGDTDGVVVDDINENIKRINAAYKEICEVFKKAGIEGFVQLPRDDADRQKFRKLFVELRNKMNAIRLQGFKWDNEFAAKLDFVEKTYKILKMRYEDLGSRGGSGVKTSGKHGFNIDTRLSEIALSKIDIVYLETYFKDIVVVLEDLDKPEDEKTKIIKAFAAQLGILPENQQKYARIVIEDIRNGKLVVDKNKSFIEYISDYMHDYIATTVVAMADNFGIDCALLEEIVQSKPSEETYNDGYKFTRLCDGCDINRVRVFFENKDGGTISEYKARKALFSFLKDFVINGIYI